MTPAPTPHLPVGQKHRFSFGLSFRLALLVLGFGAASALLLLVIHHHQMSQFVGVFAQQQQEEALRLAAQIELVSRTQRNFAHDYSFWDDMVQFVRTPNRNWSRENIDPAIDSFQLDHIWVLNRDRELLHHAARKQQRALPLSRQDLQTAAALGYFTHCFLWVDDGLMEIRIAPIQPSSDSARVTPPQGWLIAGRLWDSRVIGELQQTSGLKIDTAHTWDPLEPGDFRQSRLAFSQELPGPDGNTIALIHATRYVPLVSGFARLTTRSTQLLGGVCLILFLFLMAAIHFTFNAPLHILTRAASSGDPGPGFQGLLARSDELGHLAARVDAMRDYQQTMEKEIQMRREAERRLLDSTTEQEIFARELHDDTLQTLYAIGLSLDSFTRKTNPAPEEIRQLIGGTLPEINRTIASLRVAIAGLENHQTDPARLQQVLQRILDGVAKPAGLHTETRLQPEALAALGRTQIFHLVRLVREIATNTVKHAAARNFVLELALRGSMIEIRATDDGRGLGAEAATTGGSGLRNLQQRASQMGATLQHLSPPGGGTTILLEIPLHET